MASVNVKIFPEEKDKLVEVIKKFKGQTVAVSKLAKEAGFNPNRTRFIVDELLEDGRIKRNVTKSFNKQYTRYSYEVIK